MSLQDITRESVLAAINECDNIGRELFLERYGFGPAARYFLRHGEKRYDSKAILGVAHKYARPEIGPLLSDEFSGGEMTVAKRLEQLGFEIERLPRNPSVDSHGENPND